MIAACSCLVDDAGMRWSVIIAVRKPAAQFSHHANLHTLFNN